MSNEKPYDQNQPPSYPPQPEGGGYPGAGQPYPGGEASSYRGGGGYPAPPQQSYGGYPPQQYPPPPQGYPPQPYPPQQYPQQQGYYPPTPAPQPGYALPPQQKKSDKEALCYGCALGACLCCCLDGLC